MSDPKPDLKSAYALTSVEDNRQLYANWAKDYDSGFAKDMAYILHLHVVEAFCNMGGRGPVLDIGAGTGLAGEALVQRQTCEIDGVDVSQDMLEVAKSKAVYRNLIVADVTQPLDLDTHYNGLISSGTFTHGHVGPDAIDYLLDICAKGAKCALSVNKEHWQSRGFEQKFHDLRAKIDELETRSVRIYQETAAGDHVNDRALIVTFVKQ